MIVQLIATTEDLLRRLDALPPGHPDRAALRDAVISENLPMAARLAGRYTGRGEPLDDLVQIAALALVKAVDGFDPGRGVPFIGYAIPSILGGLKRHFRDTTWVMRVPRSAQELAGRVIVATDRLGHDRGRSPTTAELADHLDVTVTNLRAAVSASQVYRLVSLDTGRPDGHVVADVVGRADPHYAAVDDQLLLRSLLAALPPRERRILALRFGDEMTQSRIAAEIGVSQMQISRLLTRSLANLRAAMPDTQT